MMGSTRTHDGPRRGSSAPVELPDSDRIHQAPDDPLDCLTAAERRVAELVAGGASSPEAAAALWVTEHAIKFHLSRIYRKLGIRSRSELAALVAGGVAAPRVVEKVVFRDRPSKIPAELAALRGEVERLRAGAPCEVERWRPETPASRHTVTVAVRRVASARGRRETIERLRQLAAEALAWAALLDVGPVRVRR